MLKRYELDEFWKSRAEKHDSPCHYMNHWMDHYAWITRTKALWKCRDLFSGKKVVDIGCGDGRYSNYLAKLVDKGYVVGLDRPEMIEKAKKNYQTVQFLPGTVTTRISNSNDWQWTMGKADIVTLLTVYDFLTIEERASLLLAANQMMKPGSMVMILDLFPTKVPEYQKGLGYKEVETREKKLHDWFNAGFDLEREIPVNYMDTKLFYKLGKTGFTYWLTRIADKVLAFFRKPKYSLVVFRKL